MTTDKKVAAINRKWARERGKFIREWVKRGNFGMDMGDEEMAYAGVIRFIKDFKLQVEVDSAIAWHKRAAK